MTLLGKLKAGAIAVAVAVGVILTAIAKAYFAGRNQQRADQIIADRKQEERVDARLDEAHDAGRRVTDDLKRDDGLSGDLRKDDGFKRSKRPTTH